MPPPLSRSVHDAYIYIYPFIFSEDLYILLVTYQITNDSSISIVESRILQNLVLIGTFSSIARFNYWKITYASSVVSDAGICSE